MNLGTILSPEDEQKICDLHLNHQKSMQDLMKMFKVGDVKLRKIFKENGIDSFVRVKPPPIKKIFSQEEIEIIINEYAKGKSLNEIGKMFGCQDGPIRRILKEKQLLRLKNATFYSELKTQNNELEIIRLFSENKMAINKIGEKFGVGKIAIKKILQKHNVKPKKVYERLTKEREIQIINEYLNSDKTQKNIADEFSVCDRTVFEILTKNKIPRRKSKHIVKNPDRRPPYQKLVDKYGPELAEIKFIESNKKRKETRLKNLEKFGSPIPTPGGGYGIRVIYKNIFFRSLTELSYFVKEIETKNFIWESAEQLKFRIPYVFANKKRSYFPDFFVENKYLIEIKPMKKQNDPVVQKKAAAAKEFCKLYGFEYQMLGYKTDFELLRKLYKENMISAFKESEKSRMEKTLFRDWAQESIEIF